MSTEYSTRVHLRIMGPDLVPDTVTERLGLQPDHSHRRGDPRRRPEYAPYASGQWSYTLESEAESLDSLLVTLCRQVEERSEALEALLANGLEADVFVGIFGEDVNVSLEISPQVMLSLGSLGLPLGLDVYTMADD